MSQPSDESSDWFWAVVLVLLICALAVVAVSRLGNKVSDISSGFVPMVPPQTDEDRAKLARNSVRSDDGSLIYIVPDSTRRAIPSWDEIPEFPVK